MGDVNGHGLSRNIPAAVKRQVRQACGFGCVICGAVIVEYEHVDPPFAWATSHDPAAIALLCPQCHAKVTRKFMSKATVSAAMNAPICKRQGYASEVFELGQASPILVFGGVTLHECPIPVQVKGLPLIQVQPGEEPGAPFRLTGTFCDGTGLPSLEIIENKWRPLARNWDMEAVGGVITVRQGPGGVSLRLRVELPDRLVVERLDMFSGGYRIVGDPSSLFIVTPGGGTMTMTGGLMSHCGVGLALE